MTSGSRIQAGQDIRLTTLGRRQSEPDSSGPQASPLATPNTKGEETKKYIHRKGAEDAEFIDLFSNRETTIGEKQTALKGIHFYHLFVA